MTRRTCNECVMKPIFNSCGNWTQQSSSNNSQRQNSRHVRWINWREREFVSTQLAKLFSAVSHPLRQTLLMNIFDASSADARKEQWTVWNEYKAPSDQRQAIRIVNSFDFTSRRRVTQKEVKSWRNFVTEDSKILTGNGHWWTHLSLLLFDISDTREHFPSLCFIDSKLLSNIKTKKFVSIFLMRSRVEL